MNSKDQENKKKAAKQLKLLNNSDQKRSRHEPTEEILEDTSGQKDLNSVTALDLLASLERIEDLLTRIHGSIEKHFTGSSPYEPN